MQKRYNPELECYEEGYYEENTFVPLENIEIPEPYDESENDNQPVGTDAMREAWIGAAG